jgi:ribonuclease HI
MYSLYFDGASRKNPGPASFGGVIYNESGEEFDTYYKFIGTATNNVAEYCGLLAGLHRARELNIKELKVFGDSNLIIQQVTGKWKVKNATLRAIYNQIKEVEPFFTVISYQHVYRKDNKRADQLANIALDTRE